MPNHIIHDTLYALNLYYQFLLTKTTQSGPGAGSGFTF